MRLVGSGSAIASAARRRACSAHRAVSATAGERLADDVDADRRPSSAKYGVHGCSGGQQPCPPLEHTERRERERGSAGTAIRGEAGLYCSIDGYKVNIGTFVARHSVALRTAASELARPQSLTDPQETPEHPCARLIALGFDARTRTRRGSRKTALTTAAGAICAVRLSAGHRQTRLSAPELARLLALGSDAHPRSALSAQPQTAHAGERSAQRRPENERVHLNCDWRCGHLPRGSLANECVLRIDEACVTRRAGGPSQPTAPGPTRRRPVPEQAITNVCSMFPQCV